MGCLAIAASAVVVLVFGLEREVLIALGAIIVLGLSMDGRRAVRVRQDRPWAREVTETVEHEQRTRMRHDRWAALSQTMPIPQTLQPPPPARPVPQEAASQDRGTCQDPDPETQYQIARRATEDARRALDAQRPPSDSPTNASRDGHQDLDWDRYWNRG